VHVSGIIKNSIALLALISIISSAMPADAAKKLAPAGTPTRAIQDLDEVLDDFKTRQAGKPLSESDQEFNRKLKKRIIHGTFDIRELARLSLGKHWKARSKKEQDQFVSVLTDLLEEKALFSKEQSAAKSKTGGKYYVIYRGDRFINKEQTRAFVKTKVVVPSENIKIELNYKMKKVKGAWMIYDIIVDEASLVNNYRYQFNSIITKNGYPDLIGRMERKLAEIKGQRNQ
jgi:phospholipid transport system substrate-binding protein